MRLFVGAFSLDEWNLNFKFWTGFTSTLLSSSLPRSNKEITISRGESRQLQWDFKPSTPTQTLSYRAKCIIKMHVASFHRTINFVHLISSECIKTLNGRLFECDAGKLRLSKQTFAVFGWGEMGKKGETTVNLIKTNLNADSASRTAQWASSRTRFRRQVNGILMLRSFLFVFIFFFS